MRLVGSTSFGQVGRALTRRAPLLARDGETLGLQVGASPAIVLTGWSSGRRPAGTLPAMAVVKPFRALRYDEAAGLLESLAALPYDVISTSWRSSTPATCTTSSA